MKNLLSFIYLLDKSFWDEKINTNRYFATISLLYCALLGALLGGINYLNGMLFDIEIGTFTLTVCFGNVIMVTGLNIAESIIAAENARTAILRSLLMIVFMPVGFVLGYIASVIVLVVITIILGIFIIVMMIKFMLGGSNSGGNRIELDNGVTLKESKGMLGESYYQGDDGKSYSSDDGRTFHQD